MLLFVADVKTDRPHHLCMAQKRTLLSIFETKDNEVTDNNSKTNDNIWNDNSELLSQTDRDGIL